MIERLDARLFEAKILSPEEVSDAETSSLKIMREGRGGECGEGERLPVSLRSSGVSVAVWRSK